MAVVREKTDVDLLLDRAQVEAQLLASPVIESVHVWLAVLWLRQDRHLVRAREVAGRYRTFPPDSSDRDRCLWGAAGDAIYKARSVHEVEDRLRGSRR